jgi:hypothetical protein
MGEFGSLYELHRGIKVDGTHIKEGEIREICKILCVGDLKRRA